MASCLPTNQYQVYYWIQLIGSEIDLIVKMSPVNWSLLASLYLEMYLMSDVSVLHINMTEKNKQSGIILTLFTQYI